MKAYKIKSLIYLSVFVAAAIVYYHVEQNEIFENGVLNSQLADLEAEDQPEAEKETAVPGDN